MRGVGIYLADLADFAAVNAVMKDYFKEPYPARSTIGVRALPRGAAVEIDAICFRSSARRSRASDAALAKRRIRGRMRLIRYTHAGNAPRIDAGTVTDAGGMPVSALAGVGPALANTLERLGLIRCQDLWFHLPLRYEDRTRVTPIRELRDRRKRAGRRTHRSGRARFSFSTATARRDRRRFQRDLVAALLSFSCAAQVAQMEPGARLRCYGEVRHGAHGPEIVHPQYQRLADDDVGGAPIG